jgi:hypothetical protein
VKKNDGSKNPEKGNKKTGKVFWGATALLSALASLHQETEQKWSRASLRPKG